ncbi:protogenin A-like isoform X2 [Tachypleus tridentatus]|uniref:protogenin A-like isoform X2 n=1 Tax=Tachypleus tridentatus TaxID=6853 RepID=UPI003FD02D31
MESRNIQLTCLLSVIIFTTFLKGSEDTDLNLHFMQLSPSEVVVLPNEPFLLNCPEFSGAENETLEFSWLYKGIKIQDSRRQVLQNGSLYFKRVLYQDGKGKEQDDGEYNCVIGTTHGKLLSLPFKLIVARAAKNFTVEPESVAVWEGGVARFRCQIDAVPVAVISWKRNGQDLPQTDNRYIELPSGILQIINISKTDTANYHCIAQNPSRTISSRKAKLSLTSDFVQARALEFLSSPQSVVKLTREKAILECLVLGFPKPTLTWKREDGRSLPTDRVSIIGQGNLVIDLVHPDDAGSYLCSAETTTTAGKKVFITQKTTLKVHVPPEFLIKPQDVSKATPQTIRLNCVADGIPSPSVTWYKDGKPLLTNTRIKLKGSRELVITQTEAVDSGIYQCMARNVAGTNLAAALLTLMFKGNQPSVPHDLKAEAISSTSMKLTWKPSSGNVQAYSVHYFLQDTGGDSALEYDVVSVDTEEKINNLKPFTNYSFYVRAYTGITASEKSDVITQQTQEDVPTMAPSIMLTCINPTTLHVAWEEIPAEAAQGIIIGYRIFIRVHKQASFNTIEVGPGITEYNITGLQPKQKYDIKVSAGTSKGYTVLSDSKWPWVTQKMPSLQDNKVPPSPNMHLTVINSTTLEVKWDISHYNFQALKGFSLSCVELKKSQIKLVELPADKTNYFFEDLKPNTWYEVRIKAISQPGDGLEAIQTILTFSDEPNYESNVEIVEPSESYPCYEIKATPLSSTSIKVKWKIPEDLNATYYTVNYYAIVDEESMKNLSSRNFIRSTKNEVVLKQLFPFTTYEIFVQLHNLDIQAGPFSQKVKCTTLEDVPGPPIFLNWSVVDVHTIRVSWRKPIHPNGIIQKYQVLYNTHMKNTNMLNAWHIKEESGNRRHSIIGGLASNQKYFLLLRAATSAGVGISSPVVSFRISSALDDITDLYQNGVKSQDPFLGVVIGLSVGISCIIICVIIIMCRNRVCPTHPVPPPMGIHYSACCSGQQAPHHNGQHTGGAKPNDSDCEEMDSLTPIMIDISTSTTEKRLDSKGGYPRGMCNGCINGYTHPLVKGESTKEKNNGTLSKGEKDDSEGSPFLPETKEVNMSDTEQLEENNSDVDTQHEVQDTDEHDSNISSQNNNDTVKNYGSLKKVFNDKVKTSLLDTIPTFSINNYVQSVSSEPQLAHNTVPSIVPHHSSSPQASQLPQSST